jgi:hypothetical protein
MVDDLEAARATVKKLASLGGGGEVMRKAAARTLATLTPSEAALLLEQVIELARTRWAPAVAVVQAFTRALEFEAADLPQVMALRRVAALQDQPAVEALFPEGQVLQEYDPDAAARADARLFTAPLGWLKTRARLTRNPDELARLAVVSNATVVREVLRNSRVTEDLVVRIAARRPARPEPLVEIWHSTKWSKRPAVRRALAFNPYFPPDVGAKIVPLLTKLDLEELAQNAAVHPSLREAAQVLLKL